MPGIAANTFAQGNDDNGQLTGYQLTGYYIDANGTGHGFVDTVAAIPEPSSLLLVLT